MSDLMLRAQDFSPGALWQSALPGLAISLFPGTLGWVDSRGGISFPAGTLWVYRAIWADPRSWGFGIQPLLRHPPPSPRIIFSTPLAIIAYFLIWFVPDFPQGQALWYLLFYCLFETLVTVSVGASPGCLVVGRNEGRPQGL